MYASRAMAGGQKETEMEFRVLFKSRGGYVYNMAGFYFGIDLADKLRQQTGAQALDMKRVDNAVPYTSLATLMVDVPEEMARDSGLFGHSGEVTVIVPQLYMNSFSVLRPQAWRNDQTGEVYKVAYTHAIDSAAVLSAWRAAGYPLHWGESEEGYEEEGYEEEAGE